MANTPSSPPDRRSPRLRSWDYRWDAAYFITINTHDARHLFGAVLPDGTLRLNDAGLMVLAALEEIPKRFPGVHLGVVMVMPSHVHVVFVFNQTIENVTPAISLCDLVLWFKTATVRRYALLVRAGKAAPYVGKLWQRSFWDRIIRTEREWEDTCVYVLDNPLRWAERMARSEPPS